MAGRPRATFDGDGRTREGRAFKAQQMARHQYYLRRKESRVRLIRGHRAKKGPRGGVTGGLG